MELKVGKITLRELSVEILSEYTEVSKEKVYDLFCTEFGYQTPKLDTRAAIFKDEKILSQLKSMPGGLSEGARSSVGGTDDSPSKSTGLISKLLEKEIQSSSKYLEIRGKIKYQEEQLNKMN